MPAQVVGIEYDPNRTCHIALLEYADGTRRYILAPKGLKDGDSVMSSFARLEPKPGNCMPLRHIPTGLTVHNIEFEPGKGGKLCRSAGAGARLTNKEGRWATLVLPSGEIRQVSIDCRATVGQIGNSDHQQREARQGRSQSLAWAGSRRSAASRRTTPATRWAAARVAPRAVASRRARRARSPRAGARARVDSGRIHRILRRRRSRRYGQLKL